MKIGIIGLGSIGKSLAVGLKTNQISVEATVRKVDEAKELSERFSIKCHTDNKKLIEACDTVLFCVKPHQLEDILKNNQTSFNKNHFLISVCSGIQISSIQKWSNHKGGIIRAMPNTPSSVKEGMTAYAAGPAVSTAQSKIAQTIFDHLGKSVQIEESLMSVATGLSGCGPAYVFLIIEALSEAGVKGGLPRKVSTLLATQTLLGAAKLLSQSGLHPAALKDEITTPAGSTVDGLMALEEGALRSTLIKAVSAASEKSRAIEAKLNPS